MIIPLILLVVYLWVLPEQDLSLVTLPAPYPRDGLKVKLRKLNNTWFVNLAESLIVTSF